MTGRVRESIFSILANRLVGARVLDLYAGSGSLGLEALSRGAAEATFVERNKDALRAIEQNVAALGLGGIVLRGSVPQIIDQLPGGYDLIFVDPPYADADDTVSVMLRALDTVAASDVLIVLHRQAASVVELPEFLTWNDNRRYGDAVVAMMERATS
jgi:16S rRNA (guanine966-N2)-methyltransferase